MAIFKKINPEIDRLPLRNMFVFSFLTSSIVLFLGLISQLVLPPEIPLFYNLPLTTEQLAKSILIILPSAVSMLITTLNIVVSIKINDNYLKKSLAFASLIVTTLSSITTLKIIFLVGSI